MEAKAFQNMSCNKHLAHISCLKEYHKRQKSSPTKKSKKRKKHPDENFTEFDDTLADSEIRSESETPGEDRDGEICPICREIEAFTKFKEEREEEDDEEVGLKEGLEVE
jgi:hypothetical protein